MMDIKSAIISSVDLWKKVPRINTDVTRVCIQLRSKEISIFMHLHENTPILLRLQLRKENPVNL